MLGSGCLIGEKRSADGRFRRRPEGSRGDRQGEEGGKHGRGDGGGNRPRGASRARLLCLLGQKARRRAGGRPAEATGHQGSRDRGGLSRDIAFRGCRARRSLSGEWAGETAVPRDVPPVPSENEPGGRDRGGEGKRKNPGRAGGGEAAHDTAP